MMTNYLSFLNPSLPDKTFDELKDLFNPKGIFVKYNEDLGLFLVKYDKTKCNLMDPDIRMCRGLILDSFTNKIVCAPPQKSIDLNTFLNQVPSDNIIFEEFLDGTMINLFYYKGDKYDGWLISTRSCIGANCRWYSEREFKDLFNECKDFDYELFNKEYCYTFVLQHPENRIVEKLENPRVVLVGVNKIEECGYNYVDTQIAIDELKEKGLELEMPKRFTFDNINDAINSVTNMDYQQQGYILKCGNLRTKIRNPKYNFVKSLRGNTNNYLKNYLELRQNGFLNSYLEFFPEMTEEFNGYMKTIHDITNELFRHYQDCFVRKTKKHKDVPFIYKPLCFELQKTYIETRQITTFTVVKNFINTMPVVRQLFLFNNLDHE